MEKIKIDLDIKSDDQVLLDMKKEYENCPSAVKYISSLGLTEEQIDENIPKIYDFVMDCKACSNCPGISKCNKNNKHVVTKIVLNNGYVDREIIPCREYSKLLALIAKFVAMDFPIENLNIDLLKIDKTSARKEAVTLYSQYLKGESNRWIYLTGAINSGRSYLANAIAVHFAKTKSSKVGFLNCNTGLKNLNDLNYKDKDEFAETMNLYSSIPFLVLDDFGNEYKSDFIRDAILIQILSARAAKKLFTIFTSDFSIEEVVGLYSTSKPGEIRAKQIGKLLTSNCGKEISLGDLSIY